ncbi:DUF1924 domain-containing protein [Sulfuriflexus mobilis]|uniref:DUF1924 domain-containing protein n=1 Tax=Sulfuriflexus mobilis TaxID=1811807 RepID=UPI000F84001A
MVITTTLLLAQTASAGTTVDTLLDTYRAAGAGPFQAEAGQRMWGETYRSNSAPTERSCKTCHTNNLTASGQHSKTLKPIKPLAPSVNAERLTNSKRIEKWFTRNCKWTIGRECSPQEKGDFLLYIQNQ